MISKKELRGMRATTGVYIFYENKTPIYIGKAINIKARLLSHLQNSRLDEKENRIITQATHISIHETLSEFDALLLEAKLINTHKPKYNSVLRDDKSYLYIKITTKEAYPKIFPVRRENDKKSRYFGPFESARLTYYIIRQLRNIVPFCTQPKITNRPCFYSHIGLCNPCPNAVWKLEDSSQKASLYKKYRQNIQKVIRVLEGRAEKVISELEHELKKAVAKNNFEDGIIIRNKLLLFRNFLFNRAFYTEKLVSGKNIHTVTTGFFRFMMGNFGVAVSEDKKDTYRIECYDISNLFGKQATGSMVVFEGGKSMKDQYRRFKIKTVKKISDFDMIEEIFRRRFSKAGWRVPDLIVIDGGMPQLRKVSSVLRGEKLTIPHIGIAKNPDRIIFPFSKNTLRLQTPLPVFNLICEARDEAHRFAKKYHLFLRREKIMI